MKQSIYDKRILPLMFQ